MAFLNLFFKKANLKGKNETVTLKDRFSALRNLPRFFKLVWQTSPSLTIANAALRILKSATPVAILYVGKLIIDQVVQISHGKQNMD